MLTGLSRRVRELGRGDRDRYACCYVAGESKGRGRLNWTVGRSPSACERDPNLVYKIRVGKGLTLHTDGTTEERGADLKKVELYILKNMCGGHP